MLCGVPAATALSPSRIFAAALGEMCRAGVSFEVGRGIDEHRRL